MMPAHAAPARPAPAFRALAASAAPVTAPLLLLLLRRPAAVVPRSSRRDAAVLPRRLPALPAVRRGGRGRGLLVRRRRGELRALRPERRPVAPRPRPCRGYDGG